MRPDTIASFFSDKTNRFYKLFKTQDWPALEISGIRMHLVKGTTPKKSSYDMIEPLKPLKGIVLDTCAGLGYTAKILVQEPRVKKVYTFEVDENVLELAKINPFSKQLFSDKKIVLENKSVADALKGFPDNFFHRILHDPPSIRIAGELYSGPFYAELFRVLKPQGILFHYTGRPGHLSGRDVPKSVETRLLKAGFYAPKWFEKAQGLRARKHASE